MNWAVDIVAEVLRKPAGCFRAAVVFLDDWRAFVLGLALTSLVGASLLNPFFADMASADVAFGVDDVYPAVKNSNEVVGMTIASGRLAPGAKSSGNKGGVYLYAWPSNEALAVLRVGKSLRMRPVAKAHVARDGSFNLKVRNLSGLRPYASRLGDVNLVVAGEYGGTSFSRNLGVRLADLETEGSTSNSPVADLGKLKPIGAADKATSGVSAYSGRSTYGSCSTKKVRNLGNRWVPVGGLFSTNSGGTIDYQYSKGQSSSLGTSVSAKSSTAGFSASGTTSVSSTATIDFPPRSGKGSRLAKTQFNYAVFKTTCIAPFVSRTTWTVRPTAWVGGTNWGTVAAPKATYCVSYLKGSKFTKDKHKQVTWTGAVTFYGVGLSAQTGWSSKGKLLYHFKSKRGELCGVSGNAVSSKTYQIVMK